MKKEAHLCDINKCQKNIEVDDGKKEVKMQVIFSTDQTEGRSVPFYFDFVVIDLCGECYKKALEGNYIFAIGAMGFNEYGFKNQSML